MKPVYFPHTYLPVATADSLRNLFPSVAVYQPTAGRVPEDMRPLVENGFLEVVAPAAGDEAAIDRAIRAFEEWGRLHQGGSGFEAIRMHGFAFGEHPGAEEGLYSIAAQLKRRMSSELAAKTVDTVFTARVFLQVAQAVDEQHQQIAGELARFERSQANLFEALKGGRDPAASDVESPAVVLRGHDADDRIELRLAAWARLFLKYPFPSPVFVTSSIALIRHLAETLEGRRQVRLQDFAGAAGEVSSGHGLSPEESLRLLEDLAAGRIALPEPRSKGLQTSYVGSHVEEACLHVWPDISPLVFFSRLYPEVAPMNDIPPAPVAWRHTILVPISGLVKTTSRLDTLT
jgi:hypothetical protein